MLCAADRCTPRTSNALLVQPLVNFVAVYGGSDAIAPHLEVGARVCCAHFEQNHTSRVRDAVLVSDVPCQGTFSSGTRRVKKINRIGS